MSILFTLSDAIAIENLSVRWAAVYDLARKYAGIRVGEFYSAQSAFLFWETNRRLMDSLGMEIGDLSKLFHAHAAFLALKESMAAYQGGELGLSFVRKDKARFISYLRQVEF